MAQIAMAQEKPEDVMLREGEFVSMRQAIGRSGGHSLVVLGPPGQETPPDVVVEDESDRNGRPNVGHVVRSPDKSTD